MLNWLAASLAAALMAAPGAGAAQAPEAFTVEEVRVPADGATLAGSLYLPAERGPHPAVVLIHGAGPQTRGWPYDVHARDFASRGIAALTYDKRGLGKSTGTYSEVADFDQLAADAAAATKFLKARRQIHREYVGVWGRSQGAWIAPMVAARETVGFAMLIVGGGVPVLDQNLFAARRRLERAGYTSEEIATILEAHRLVARYFVSADGYEEARAAFAAVQSSDRLKQAPNDLLNRLSTLPGPDWVRSNQDGVLAPLRETDFDPAAYLAKLSVPTLAVLAGEDVLTPTQETAAILTRTLASRSNGSAVVVLPGADHTLCPAAPGKDFQPNCTFAPGYEALMGKWLEQIANPRPAAADRSGSTDGWKSPLKVLTFAP